MYTVNKNSHALDRDIVNSYFTSEELATFDAERDNIIRFNTPYNKYVAFTDDANIDNLFVAYYEYDQLVTETPDDLPIKPLTGRWIIVAKSPIADSAQRIERIYKFICDSGLNKKYKYYGVMSPAVNQIHLLNVMYKKKSIIDQFLHLSLNVLCLGDMRATTIYRMDKVGIPYNDHMGVIVPGKNGLVHLNCQDIGGLVFTLLRKVSKHHFAGFVKKLLNDHNGKNTAFDKMFDGFIKVRDMPTSKFYANIYKMMSVYDTVYHDKKFPEFRAAYIGLIDRITTITDTPSPDNNDKVMFVVDFIRSLERIVCFELFQVYWRWYKYPAERITNIGKFKQHPYVVLINIIHNESTNAGRYVSIDYVRTLLFANQNRYLDVLIYALKFRSALFEPTYNRYLETKVVSKKHNSISSIYYPFKIYSEYLFIIEHMLRA